MFDYFWLRVTQAIPDGVGFALFDGAHLTALSIVIVGIVVLPTMLYKRLDESGRRKMRIVIACLATASDVAVQLTYLIAGDYTPARLPLHLCSMGQYVIFIDCFKPRPVLREIMYSLTIWSTMCAAIFPDWAGRPIMNIFSWQSFAIHGLLALYPVMILVSGEFRPSWKRLWQVCIVLAGWTVMSLIINARLGTNLMLLNTAAPGSPLEPIQSFAGTYYIPVLIFLLLLLWSAMYTPWALKDRRRALAIEADTAAVS